MPKDNTRNLAVATAIGVWADFALQVFGSLNSSPQTTELFVGARKATLWHWVMIADAVAIVGAILGGLAGHTLWPLVAAVAVVAGMHLMYQHAVNRGEGQSPPEMSYP